MRHHDIFAQNLPGPAVNSHIRKRSLYSYGSYVNASYGIIGMKFAWRNRK